jgi:hypothetical protein
MLTVDQSIEALLTSWPSIPLTLIQGSVISIHHAKEEYNYPTVRLPHTFSRLAGLPTRIYQTVHEGGLAFLVVVYSSDKSEEKSLKKLENFSTGAKSPVLT